MKLTKEKIINLSIILGIGVVLFTPTGFELKVILNRFLSFSPTELKSDDQQVLLDYNWQLSSQDRGAHNFNEYNDKVVVLNFWATWCPPCVAEMPSMQQLYTDYNNKVVFMFVTSDDHEKVTSFLKKKGYDIPVYYPLTEVPKMLSSKLLPTTYIINKNGKIVVAETGAADWNSLKTRKLLDTLLQE